MGDLGDQGAFNGSGNAFHTAFEDPVFQPSPDFNFEEEPYHMIPEAFDQPGDFSLYDPNSPSGFPPGPSAASQERGALSQVHWQGPFPQDFASQVGMPHSTQGEIVDNRQDSAAHFFGQVTPPDTDSAINQKQKSQEAHEADAFKRKERARNAANKRHAKSKKPRAGSESTGADEETTADRGERQAHYREKNRVAAAKCRAKKKNHNDQLEEIHRDEASKNRILKAELMGLRNELAQLKGLTLEHGQDSCQCHGIHEYSMRQANIIARGAAPQFGPSVVSSPTQDSAHSGDTPVSEVAGDGIFPAHDQMSPVMGPGSRRTSFVPGDWM